MYVSFRLPMLSKASHVLKPMVEIQETSNTSIGFTWNAHSPCNTRVETVITYEYEARKGRDVIYSGTQSDTVVAFEGLEPGTGYTFRVRVSVVLQTSGKNYYSSWTSWISAATNSVPVIHTTTTAHSIVSPSNAFQPLLPSTGENLNLYNSILVNRSSLQINLCPKQV